MLHLGYSYTDLDGEHWPDVSLGSKEFYCIEFAEKLSKENDTLVEIEWVIPEGVIATEDFHSGSEAYVNLAPQKRGTFEILCNISLTETALNGKSYAQIIAKKMMLKVT